MKKLERNRFKISRVISNNVYALKLLFGATPVYGISIIVEAVRHNFSNFLEHTICVYFVLDAIEYQKPYMSVVKVIALLLVVELLSATISNLFEHRIKIKYLPIAQQSIKNKLYQKAREVDIANYDNPTYYNDYVMVVSEADKAVERADQLIRMIFSSITILLCYGIFFCTQDVISMLFVFASYALRTIFSNLSNKLRYEIRLKEIPLERKRDYIRRVFYLKDYAKEIRLNKDVTNQFHEEFDEIGGELHALYRSVAVKRFLFDFAAKYLVSDFLLDIIYVFYLIVRASIYKLISYSQVVVLYNSVSNLRRGLSMITDLGPYAIETSLYIDKIRKFLDTESEIVNEKKYELPKGEVTLECRNLSFGYDDKGLILKNINLKINSSEKIALVGYNGAGKTTLIKLLLRLYDPIEGVILLNGRDIRDYDIEEYRNYIGVTFQDFQMYATTVEQNVVMDIKQPGEEAKVIEDIKRSGFYNRFKKLEHGLDTEITCEFMNDGTDLSGGEEQKLAIARTMYKETGIMLLDEPSSALDPIAEYELNCTMNEMARDKIVIFISHRLSTTRRADRIYVLKDGRIVEEGTHDDLLNQTGIYYQMWNAQAGKYRNNRCNICMS